MTPPFLAAGSCLRHERESRNISLRKLAELVYISPSALSQIETGVIRPSLHVAMGLCNALKLGMAVRARLKMIWEHPDRVVLESWSMLTSQIAVGVAIGEEPSL